LLRPESTADRRTRRALQEDVKAAKEALSRHPQTEVPMPEPFKDVLVTRGELEGLVRPAMLRSVELLSRTLRSSGLTPDRLAGIYLVGGSSRLPLVGTMIAEKLGVVPGSLDQPETAVALGAQHVARDGLSVRTQNVEGAVAAGAPPRRPQYAPPPPPQYPGYAPSNFPPSGPQPVPSNFPAYSPAPDKAEPKPGGKKKLVIGIAAAVVVVLAAGLTFFLTSSSSVTTYTAEQCKKPGHADDKGLTGCLRQLAGKIADTGDCKPGMGNGPAAPAQQIGVSSTCSAPGRAGTQVTYVHGDDAATLKQYTDGLLASAGGDRTEADWGGNGLKGHYSSAAGKTSAVLVFTVSDRPLAGFIYQLNTTDQAQATTPGTLADYFEQSVQPGE
jgi:hypothetical protein